MNIRRIRRAKRTHRTAVGTCRRCGKHDTTLNRAFSFAAEPGPYCNRCMSETLDRQAATRQSPGWQIEADAFIGTRPAALPLHPIVRMACAPTSEAARERTCARC